jgi:hypothetical protein
MIRATHCLRLETLDEDTVEKRLERSDGLEGRGLRVCQRQQLEQGGSASPRSSASGYGEQTRCNSAASGTPTTRPVLEQQLTILSC